MDGLHNIGRFIPDSKPRTEEECRKAEETRGLTRGEKIVDTEVSDIFVEHVRKHVLWVISNWVLANGKIKRMCMHCRSIFSLDR